MKHSYAKQQSADIEGLISSHTELVRKIAWQIHGRARYITEIEDLVQIGYTGLIVAAQKYTPQEGASFASYASIRIRGAIVDYLRKSSNLCRTTIQIKKKYNAAVSHLERTLMRAATRAEIAQEMGITEDELVKWETAFQANTPQSLDAVYDQFSMWFVSDQSTPEEPVSYTHLTLPTTPYV